MIYTSLCVYNINKQTNTPSNITVFYKGPKHVVVL